ncbi:MAG: DegT/DnrJ/EryC1/StrS aminotransferase family protein [Armatimonadetes bacterium]|nr:DegT/DnrJ/EryC1/StrS aminotransferase family protein [Armatimonadota bacterium]
MHYTRPSIGPREIETVTTVLQSGWIAFGPYKEQFEKAFAQFINTPYALSTNSCTSALEVVLEAAGISGEVILPSLTWVATANAVVQSGATPVFCDVNEATRNATGQTLEERLSSRTEAVIVVHYGGQPCRMDEVLRFCKKHHLFLIEDSAQTLGATWHDQQAGSFGCGCFSFYATKAITTAEGGMLTLQDAELARKAGTLISHGIDSTPPLSGEPHKPWLRAAIRPGHNYRMSNLQAALGYCQLQRLDELNRRRIALAQRYDDGLKETHPLIKTPSVAEGATHVYQLYTIQVRDDLRNGVLQYLWEHGVSANVHFDPPVHRQPCYTHYGSPSHLPVTEKLAAELISLPLFPDLQEEEQEWVIECLKKAIEALA